VSSDLSPDQQAKAEAHFGGTPLIQMYGMTETSGQITSNPLPPHARKPGSVGQPDGAEVAILDRTGARVPQGSVAEVCVRGQGVTAGYEATDRAAHFHADWLRTGDTGYLDADGYLFLAGRVKEMINRGGEKISPLEIERAALSLLGLQEAAAFALPHPTLGEHVGLAAVVDPGSGLTEVRILAHLRGQIAEYKLPRRVQMLEALPRLGSGKINKRALMAGRADAAKAPDWQGEAAVVAGLWQKILAAPVPGPDDDYFDMGGDSLSAMQFLLALEAKLGRKLPPNALYEAPRFEAFLARISKGDSHSFVGDGDPVLDHLRSRTFGWQGQRVGRYGLLFGLGTVAEKVPLFMCSQGETMAFRAVIDPGRPLYLMPSLSEFDGETPAIEQHVARIYADEIEAIQPEGLLYLSGFCGGVRLMREVAEELYARGRDIGFLTSVDKWFDRPTPYPVLHVFTENRRHSAVERFRKPHLAFPYLHPRGADWVRVKGNHSKALKVDPLRPAGAAIERWMQADGALPIPEAPQGLPVEARHRAYAAGVTVRHPRWFPRGQEAVLTVTLRNQSSEVWLPTSQSGLTFAAHFDNLDKHRRAPHAGHHDLTVPVAPGEEIRFDLRLRYPDTAMPQVLTCTMVDQGFAEFTDAPGRALRRLVWANPFTA
jgi:acyl carrier protein